MDYCSVTAVITVLALVTGGWGSPNGCSAPSPVSLSSIVASTYNDTGLEIVIRRNEIICNSYAYDKLTVLCLYDRCNKTSSMQNTESVVLDIICRDGVWELTRYERFAYATISTENCTDCVAVELFESRQYPINPPDRLAYNQTTHCLMLPSCLNSAGEVIGYFSARECCIEKEESQSYRYNDATFTCIVHGFVKTQYNVLEGETVDIVFKRNAKGKSHFPLLTIQGSIASEGDDNGYQPVSVNIVRQDSEVTFSLTTFKDILEDSNIVILRHNSFIPNYVNRVEERGEFISHTAEVTIVDRTSRAVIQLEQSAITVTEGENATVEICGVVYNPPPEQSNCPVTFTFEIHLSVLDENFPMTFAPCARQACVHVPIENDAQLEQTKTVSYRLERPAGLDNRITVSSSSGRLTICDDPTDEAVIMLSRTVYTVKEEDSRRIEICANVTSPALIDTPIDFAFNVEINTVDGTAVGSTSERDFSSVRRGQIYFSIGGRRDCYSITIHNDDTQENTETFTVTLNRTSGLDPRIRLEDIVADVSILDADNVTIEFQRATYTVNENVGMAELCVQFTSSHSSCPVAYDFSLVLVNMEGSASRHNDYVDADATGTLVVEACHRVKCFSVGIVDSNQLENQESFEISLFRNGLTDNIRIGSRKIATVAIRDDDKVTVGFETTTYTVEENNLHLNVCVVVFSHNFTCPIAFPFELRLSDTPGTAFRGSDYRMTENEIRFGPCTTRQCLIIDIINNDLIEEAETFNVTLQHPLAGGAKGIKLTPKVATVTVEDRDLTTVTFERAEYTVQETSSSLRVCVRVVRPRSTSCPVNHSFNLTLLVSDGTALNGSDYIAQRQSVTEFPRCRRSWCAVPRITFINDPKDVEVEEVERFSLFLVSQSPLVSPDPDTATVNIRDNSERAYIRLEQSVFTATEAVNATVAVCAEIYNPPPERSDCPVTFPFEINLSVDGEIFPITFAPCRRRACTNVPIDNDAQLEPTKTVSFRLERPTGHDNRIVVSSSSGRMTILDDPTDEAVIKLAHTVYTVREELIRRHEICANVTSPVMDTPIDFAFNVDINTVDGTAVSTGQRDFSSVIRGRIYFSIGERKDCSSITIYNDDTQENTETFTVTLNRTSGLDPRIMLEDIVAEVSILDADNVTIEFQRATYTVNENVGMAELCVQFTSSHSSCPVAYDFSLILVNMEGSASRHNDYVDADAAGTLVVEACHRVKCFSVGIVDSNQLEDQESFEISLFKNGLTDNIRIGSRKIATVAIRDDDTVEMGLSQTSYRVVEGQVLRERMCVEVYGENGDCIVPFPIVVYITTTDGRADSPEDYTSLSRVGARFPPCTAERCADIVTINDEIVEGDENLYVSVTRDSNWDSRICLIRSRAEITIEDDDSARVTIKEQTYTVDEDQRAVNICAVVSSPSLISDNCELDFGFHVRVVPIPGTAGPSDYGSQITLSFPRCFEVVCGVLGIDNDRVMEGQEEFTISLQSSGSDARVRISAIPSIITINDDDDVTIQMQYSVVTVNEYSNRVTVCTTMSGTSDIYNAVRLSTISDTAVTGSLSDFTGTSPIVTFGPRSSRQCISINITNDDIVEEREYFNVTLGRTRGLDSRVQFGQPTVTTVFINDDDRAIVRLDPQVLEDEEGESVEICAVVESSTNRILGCVVEFDFNITLRTRGTADSTNDYSGLTSIVTVPKCRNRFCVSVELTEDQMAEVDETISIRITRTSASSIRYDSNEATITIRDNDNATLRLVRVYQFVSENVGTAEVCAEISGSPAATIAFPFDVMFTFFPASATRPEDFTSTELIARYNTNENKACVWLVVVNSRNVELPESLNVETSLREEHSIIDISPTLSYGIIEIRDDDNAVVGLSSNAYYISSTAEDVQVCVRVSSPSISCPITFPFDVFFNFTDETAAVFEVDTTQTLSEGEGILREGEKAYTLLFDTCQRDFCLDVSMRNVTGGHRGRFEILLSRKPDHGRTSVLDSAKTTGYIEIR